MPETLLDERLSGVRIATWNALRAQGMAQNHCYPIINAVVAAVEAALASLQPSVSEMGWQPIDTAPKEGPDILALWTCRVTGERVISADVSWRRDVWVSEGEGLIDPTHWMPLPNPPALSPEGEP